MLSGYTPLSHTCLSIHFEKAFPETKGKTLEEIETSWTKE